MNSFFEPARMAARRALTSIRLDRIAAAVAILLMAGLPAACSGGDSTAPAAPVAETSTAPAQKRPPDPPPMHFDSTTMTIKGKKFTVELALSDDQTETGLMYRNSMADDHGMLFVFDHPSKLEFYMKNTRIPLDIIFLDSSGHVVDIEQRRPLDEEARGPEQNTQYVIELNAGTAEKIGLTRGDAVTIPEKYLKGGAGSTDK